jgi:hypothetical protein
MFSSNKKFRSKGDFRKNGASIEVWVFDANYLQGQSHKNFCEITTLNYSLDQPLKRCTCLNLKFY